MLVTAGNRQAVGLLGMGLGLYIEIGILYVFSMR